MAKSIKSKASPNRNKLLDPDSKTYPMYIIKSNSVVYDDFIKVLENADCSLENVANEIMILTPIGDENFSTKVKTRMRNFRNRNFKSIKIQKESIRNENQWQLLISLAKEIQREKSKYLVKINTNSVEFEMLKTDFEQLQDKINNIIKPEEVDTCDLSNKFEFQCIKYIQIVHAKKIDKLNYECMKDLNLKDDSFKLKLNDSNKTYSLKIVSDQFHLNNYIDLISTFSKTKIFAYFEFDSKLVQHIFKEARVKDEIDSIEKQTNCAIIPVELTIGSNFDYKLIAVESDTSDIDSYDQMEYVYFPENDQLTSHRLLIQKMDEIFNKMSDVSDKSKFAINFIDTDDELITAFVYMFREYMKDSRGRVKVNRIHLIYSDKTMLEEIINSSERTMLIEETKLIEVKYGSLVDESLHVDVIVNSVGKDLNLNKGAISKAILNAAGSNIQQELNDKYPNLLDERKKFLAVSSAGNLVNKKIIIHASLVQWDPEDELKSVEKLKNVIEKALETSNNLTMTSVAFPPLGTDIFNYPRDVVCETMFTVVNEYLKKFKSSTSIRKVYFILNKNDQQTIQEFKNYQKTHKETQGLKIISDRIENVNKCLQRLDLIASREIVTYVLDDENISEFNDRDRQYLNDRFKSLNIQVKWDVDNNKVTLTGSSQNQSQAQGEFWKYIMNMSKNKETNLKYQQTDAKIEWQFYKNNMWTKFSDELNFKLENKFINKTFNDYMIKLKFNSHQNLIANVRDLFFTFETSPTKIPIRRNNLEHAKVDNSIPPDLVNLNHQDPDYKEILKFALDRGLKGVLNNTISIQRVQNMHLYSKYCAFKDELKIKYNQEPTELRVFHGTSKDAVDKIWRQGFNRSYAGKKTRTTYGQGVYFSRYSLASHHWTDLGKKSDQPTYQKKGHIFICKLLVGQIAIGNFTTTVPPKNKDTTVNNLDNPTIYVIYKYEQAYPEYLLTYQ